ncbi:MAG: hypothetical protein ACE5Z5_12810 [Candidatus Bathyarchaeia archaeon]
MKLTILSRGIRAIKGGDEVGKLRSLLLTIFPFMGVFSEQLSDPILYPIPMGSLLSISVGALIIGAMALSVWWWMPIDEEEEEEEDEDWWF